MLAHIFPLTLFISALTVGVFFQGYQDIHYAPASLCILGLGLYAALPIIWHKQVIAPSLPIILMLAFWLYVTLSLSWSTVPYVSLVTYLVFISGPIAFFSTVLLSKNKDWLTLVFYTVLAGLCGLAVWGVIQATFLSDTYGTRAAHPFLNANSLAGLLCLGLFPALARAAAAPQQDKHFYIHALISTLLFTGLLATQSRGGIVIAICSIIIMMAFIRPALKNMLIIAMPVFIGAMSVLVFTEFDLIDRIGNGPSTLLIRMSIWDQTWQYIKDAPILGTGLGTFYLYYPQYRLPELDTSSGQWAHMDPLQFWAEMGILAPALFYAFCGAMIYRIIKSPVKTPLGIGLCFALLNLLLHTHITFHLYILPIIIICYTWAGYVYVLTAPDKNALTILTKSQTNFFFILIAIFSCMIIFMASSSAWGVYHLNIARKEIRKGNAAEFISKINTAERFAPRSFIDPKVNLAGLYIDLLANQPDALFTTKQQTMMFEDAQDALDYAEAYNPAWAEINHKRALLWNGQDGALAQWQIAIEKDPMHYRAREAYAIALIQKGKVSEAYDVLETGLKYPHPDFINKDFNSLMMQLTPLLDMKHQYEQQRKAAE